MNNSNDVIRASEEQMRTLAEHLIEEYRFDYLDNYEEMVADQIEEMRRDPHDVSILYTTFDEVTDDDEYIEHEIQISMDLCKMINKVYVDNVFVYAEDIVESDFEFNFDGFFSYFLPYAEENIPTDEMKAREQNKYMDEHRKLIEHLSELNGGNE